MDFAALSKRRYSVRKFSSQPVEEQLLQTVLETGRSAPTAHNSQPQRIYVLRGEEALHKVDEATSCRYGAPVVLLVAADTAVAWRNDWSDHSSAEMDASIVTTHMMLQATELGLGSVFVARLDTAKAKALFELPESQEVWCMLPIGYPAEDAAPSPNHENRRPLSELVVEIG